jgi:hypothetical protein
MKRRRIPTKDLSGMKSGFSYRDGEFDSLEEEEVEVEDFVGIDEDGLLFTILLMQ